MGHDKAKPAMPESMPMEAKMEAPKMEMPAQAMPAPSHPSHMVMIVVLIAIAVLFIVAIVMSLNRQDNMTAWATIKSRELHTFFGDCRANGGSIDVVQTPKPQITFVCQYLGSMTEYTLDPGK
jgi:hypothetical protein